MFVFLTLLLTLFSSKPALALDEFNVKQEINYHIDNNGNASVDNKIQLINNFSEIYPKEYQLKLLGSNIEKIRATDSSGDILKNSDKQEEGTTISLKFNQPQIGKNQITQFQINYSIPYLAVHKGSVWEIPLPEYKNIKENEEININLFVPSNFGTLSFSSINTPNTVSLNSFTQLRLNTSTIKDKKMLFIFGNYQIFDFNLKYFLKNSSENIENTEIAIPPELDNQKIIYKNISPPPKNIKVDPDGNWLAQYQLSPQENLEVTVSGQAKIFSAISKANNTNFNILTQDQNFWPVSDPLIQQIASNFKSPKEIYDYVVNTLSYSYDSFNTAKRQGAKEAILNPLNALCTEFTDLFVTLSRARKIPARELEGYAYTNNPKIKPINENADILHAWPQYYNASKKAWVSIDPTWAKTTNGIDYFNDLDLNHFIFVIHGINSQYPLPPGSYKNNQNIKTVDIKFANNELTESFLPPQIKFDQNNIIIKNPNKNALININISLPSQKWEQLIPILPPFSLVQLQTPKTSFIKSLFTQTQKKSFLIEYQNGNGPINISATNSPHYLNSTVLIVIILVIICLSGIILAVLHKPKK